MGVSLVVVATPSSRENNLARMVCSMLNAIRERKQVEGRMDPYQLLTRQAEKSSWRNWPAASRAVLPVMARERSAACLPVWFPSVVYIEPTNACNANCVFCPRGVMTRPVGYMEMGLYRGIVDQVAKLGPSELRLFHYGEPMLHPELPEMIRYAHEQGLVARFQTNGLAITRERVAALLGAGMNYIGVSVNGLVARDYETIRPGHSFETLTRNLLLLREVIQASGTPCHIHLNAHVDRDEVRERDADIRSFKKHWLTVADSLSISGLSLYDRIAVVRRGEVSENALEELPRRSDGEVLCAEPFDRMVIKWDGRVSPCCADYDGRLILGDVTRQRVEEVWNGAEAQRLREAVRERRYGDVPLCRTCPKFYSKPYNVVFVRKKFTDTRSPRQELELI